MRLSDRIWRVLDPWLDGLLLAFWLGLLVFLVFGWVIL